MDPQEILENKENLIKYLVENGYEKVNYKDEEFPDGDYLQIDSGKLLAIYETKDEELIREIKNHFILERGLSYCAILIDRKIIFFRNFGEGRYFLYSERTVDNISKLNKLNNIKDDFDILFHRTDISGIFYESFKEKRNHLVRNIKNEISHVKKLLLAQKIFDRIFFIYFLCHKNIIKFKDGRPISGENLFNLLIENGDFYESLKKIFYSFNTYNKVNVLKIQNHEILIPYLNGGLFRFDPLEPELEFDLDKKDWRDIFDFLNKYHWIIEEDIDLGVEDEQKILTPEILGHVYERSVVEWENLEGFEREAEKVFKKISERKKKGVYYTPSEITSYIAEETIFPYLLEKLKSKHSNINELIENSSKDELKKLLNTISEIKILDPACGSGAFLIKASEIIFYLKVRLLIKLNKNPSYYDIKLNTITENIYGVDILEGAIEIAKLRLWLWLITDYRGGAEIKALPNIEYNLKVGNSLIGWTYEKLEQVSLKNPLTDEIKGIFIGLLAYSDEYERKIYEETRKLLSTYSLENYIEAYSMLYKIYRKEHGIKAENLKGIIEKIRNSIYRSIDSPFLDYMNSQIDPNFKKKSRFPISKEKYHSLIPFHWRVDFGAIFEDGGFDVIVGNPPYVRVDNLGKEEKDFWKQVFDAPYGKYDLYFLFIECLFKWLKNGGKGGYIVPNKFCAATSAENLRNVIINESAHFSIISVSHIDVFKDAANYPVLLTIGKGEQLRWIQFGSAKELEEVVSRSFLSYNVEQEKMNLLPLSIFPINVDKEKLGLAIKTLKNNKKLHKFANISEGLRIPTKYETSKKEKHAIVKQFQFDRWTKIKKDAYITHKNLLKVTSTTAGRYKNSMKNKILIAEDALYIAATLDKNKMIPQGGVYFLTLNNSYSLEYILGILNSDLMSAIYKILFGGMHMGGGYLRFRTKFLECLPIPLTPKKDEKEVENIVTEILSILEDDKKSSEIKSLVNELNKKIYEIYGISDKEKSIVESVIKT
jgi:hypothetical protein